MEKKVVLSTRDELFEKCDRRVVVFNDAGCQDWVRDYRDHHFVLWSNLRNHRGDKDAECPFIENDNGDMTLPEGVVAFPISIYEHGGIAYYLGDCRGEDAEWDSCGEAYWLWTDKEHWDRMAGEGQFEKMTKEDLRKTAEWEVKELNMDARGEYYGFREEVKRPWTKKYEDGMETHGYDWEIVDSCGGFLTDNVNDLDMNRDVPVFDEDGIFVGCELD